LDSGAEWNNISVFVLPFGLTDQLLHFRFPGGAFLGDDITHLRLDGSQESAIFGHLVAHHEMHVGTLAILLVNTVV
jgi:hypothetical protein